VNDERNETRNKSYLKSELVVVIYCGDYHEDSTDPQKEPCVKDQAMGGSNKYRMNFVQAFSPLSKT